jgi:protein-disulfide isomerase
MNNPFTLCAVLFAILLIGGSFVYANQKDVLHFFDIKLVASPAKDTIKKYRPDFRVSPARSQDKRILGNVTAPVTITTFSDYECSYCSQLYAALHKLTAEYPDIVQWEYRQLPLIININARDAAQAAECVGDLAGNNAFWLYSDFLYSNSDSLQPNMYATEAAIFGINQSVLNDCMESDVIAQRLLADEQIAITLGAEGAPFSVVTTADGSIVPIAGAVSYDTWVDLIEKYAN